MDAVAARDEVERLSRDLERLSREVARDDLPDVLGRVVAIEARLRMRLSELPAATAAAAPRVLDVTEAAAIAGTTARWLLSKTKGLTFRCDLSRKQPRFQEAGLRRWLTERRR